MTISEFRRDLKLVNGWAEMMQQHALLKLVLQIMDDAHPAKFSVNADNNGDVSPVRAGIELGTTRGYSMYDGRLKLLGTPITNLDGGIMGTEGEYLPPEPPETVKEVKPKKKKK
jgi:hypothetical protein